LSVLLYPYLPETAAKMAGFLGCKIGADGLGWSSLGAQRGLSGVNPPQVLFAKLEAERVAELRERYSGSQKERSEKASGAVAGRDTKGAMASPESASAPASANAPSMASAPAAGSAPQREAAPVRPYADLPEEQRFEKLIDLRVAKIVHIERHPKADKLYIETLDDGSGNERVIVSGLVPYYAEEELLGKHIVLVNNLKPAKLRGVESNGMLLAASVSGTDGKEAVEVLTAPWAEPGTPVLLAGSGAAVSEAEGGSGESVGNKEMITVDVFFSVPLLAKAGFAMAGQTRLSAAGQDLRLEKVLDGEIG